MPRTFLFWIGNEHHSGLRICHERLCTSAASAVWRYPSYCGFARARGRHRLAFCHQGWSLQWLYHTIHHNSWDAHIWWPLWGCWGAAVYSEHATDTCLPPRVWLRWRIRMMNSMSASSYTGIYIGRSSFSYSVVVFPLAVQKQESLGNCRKRQCQPPLVGSLKGGPWLQVETFPVHQEVNTKGSEIASRGAAPVGLAVTPAGQVVWRRSWVGRRILDAIGILLVTCYLQRAR